MAVITLVCGYAIACGLAALFSGSVLAPITACSVALAAGGLAGWLIIRDDRVS